ncbi:prefoldin subunit 1 [Musca domestica]|uniref:Prefoldin subunit 1 n=1 Tax=Musca domestica TaxID=7370 RepID=A0A1I8M471_MUSDO|nr:prefoldin subunit 1 [Musca domestica]XP_019894460.1 prefoldin subunit 1 [Musca domestica]
MEQMDMELKKAFTEMQINKIETTKKINMIDMKCDMVKTGKQKYQLTEKGTSDLTDDTRVYLSVGRMFVLTNVTDMRGDLKAKQDKCDKAIDLLSKKKEFLLKSLKDQEDGLRELVQQRKEAEAAK